MPETTNTNTSTNSSTNTPTNTSTSPTIELFPPKYQDTDYQCGNWSDILGQMASNMSTDAAIINQITAYLSSMKSNAISDALRISGIQQLQTDMQYLQGQFTGLKTLFTNPLNTSGDFLDTSLDVVSRAEAIVDTLDRLDNFANDIMSHIDTTVNFVAAIPSKIEETFNNFSNTLEKLTDFDVSSTLDKLPELVKDGFLSLDIIQDPLVMLNNIQTTVASISVTITSIRAPQNLSEARALLSTLRSIIAQAKQVKAQAERIQQSVQNLAKTLQNGNYLSLIMSLAAGGVTFFQRPPSYNARYPFNHGFKTHGGHVFEKDNTPGSERIKYTHPSKTDVEIQPDGGVVVKGQSDFQVSVSKNMDVLIKNAATITVQGDARIIANNIQVEAKNAATVSSSGTCTVNSANNVSVVADGSVNAYAGKSATIASGGTASISSKDKLYISANGIDIRSEGPITVYGTTLEENIDGIVRRTNNTCIESSDGPRRIYGTPISLN